MQLFANNISTTINGDINNSVTTIAVVDGSSMPLPNGGDYFLLTLSSLNQNGQEDTWEIVKVTGRSGNSLTVVRAQEGTAGASWVTGDICELRATSGTFMSPALHAEDIANPHNVTKTQVGLNNVDNTSDSNKPISTVQQNAIDTKQPTLISGTTIKTINNAALLGSGNITISEGHVLLVSEEVSTSVAQVRIDSNINSTYDRYIVTIDDVGLSSNDTLYMRVKVGGVYVTNPVYTYIFDKTPSSTGTHAAVIGTNQTSMKLMSTIGINSADGGSLTITVPNPVSSTTNKHLYWTGVATWDGFGIVKCQGAGGIQITSAITGFEFFSTTGTIDKGTFRLSGVTK